MKLNRIYLSLLVFFVSSGRASEQKTIKMPNKAILEERLSKAGFDHFLEKTKIKELAGRDLYPLGVAIAVETALYDYNENLKQPMMARMMQLRKPQLLEVLLEDDPAALQELADAGIYQK